MPVTPLRARTLALALDNASSYPHFDRVAFRTPRRTFATLALNGSDLNFMFDLTQQAYFCALAPHALAPVAGGWGRMGATRCDLKEIDAATFTAALQAAHARANTALVKKRPPKPAARKSALKAVAKRSPSQPRTKKPAPKRTAKK